MIWFRPSGRPLSDDIGLCRPGGLIFQLLAGSAWQCEQHWRDVTRLDGRVSRHAIHLAVSKSGHQSYGPTVDRAAGSFDNPRLRD